MASYLQRANAKVQEQRDGDEVIQRHAVRVDQLVCLVQHQSETHLRVASSPQ
jgi:hypothetical protein